MFPAVVNSRQRRLVRARHGSTRCLHVDVLETKYVQNISSNSHLRILATIFRCFSPPEIYLKSYTSVFMYCWEVQCNGEQACTEYFVRVLPSIDVLFRSFLSSIFHLLFHTLRRSSLGRELQNKRFIANTLLTVFCFRKAVD